MSEELILYADESIEAGEWFGNFYGGALVSSKDLKPVTQALSAIASGENLNGELKWQKVTAQYLPKYERMVDAFFDLIDSGKIKVRIMFTQARDKAMGLDAYHLENRYHILYYQFIKHAFGFAYCLRDQPTLLRIYLDQLPDTKERNASFKSFLIALSKSPEFRRARIFMDADQIAEVDSHAHIIMQLLDVVLGAMQFRLNDKHLEKPKGQNRRGKRTIAKEKLYKRICARVRQIHPNFNIGITTGRGGDSSNLWNHKYRHWKFEPKQRQIDFTKGKRKK